MQELAKRASEAVGMKLGLSKCAVAHHQRGSIGGQLTDHGQMRVATNTSPYVYLGIEQVIRPTAAAMFERLRKEYKKRLNKIWGSELNGKHKIRATNVWAVSLFRYYFSNLRFTVRQCAELDKLTRRIMRLHKSLHYNASIERLYLPRQEGGRGLMSLRHVWEKEVVSIAAYVARTEVEIIFQVKRNWLRRQRTKIGQKISMLKTASEILERYDLPPLDGPEHEFPESFGKALGKAQMKELTRDLCAKKIHPVFYNQCQKPGYDFHRSHYWLRDGRVQSQTEALIIAAQDGVIHTRAYRRRILKVNESSHCRLCGRGEETLGHLLAHCKNLSWTLYKRRHDRVLYQVVLCIAKLLELTIPKHLHWSVTGWAGVGVIENDQAKLTIDISKPTIETMSERRPDLIVELKSQKRILIVEIACAWDPLVPEREREKRAKYSALAKDLANQNPGHQVEVLTFVFGDLGSIGTLRAELSKSKLFSPTECTDLIRNCQREVLCAAVRIIRSTLAKP